MPQAFLFLVQKARLGSKLLENLLFQRVKAILQPRNMSRKALWIISMSGLVARSAASLITVAYTQEKFTQASHSAGESLCFAF